MNPSAFILGRSIQENFILAHELVWGYNKKHGVKKATIQVDIQSAHDSVNWRALFLILEKFGFPLQMCNYIKMCVTTPTFSILINRETKGNFDGKKGLRQGDPLSPIIFTLIMEVLSRMLAQGARDKSFSFHSKGKRTLITHISLVDDLLIFVKGEQHSMRGVMAILDGFSKFSGLNLNHHKSVLLLGSIEPGEANLLAKDLGMQLETIRIKYLGLPLVSSRMKPMIASSLWKKWQTKSNPGMQTFFLMLVGWNS